LLPQQVRYIQELAGQRIELARHWSGVMETRNSLRQLWKKRMIATM
jgi:hypothetical protein